MKWSSQNQILSDVHRRLAAVAAGAGEDVECARLWKRNRAFFCLEVLMKRYSLIFVPVWGRSPPPGRQFHSFVIGGLAIAMACQILSLANVEKDVGCARLHFCNRAFFIF